MERFLNTPWYADTLGTPQRVSDAVTKSARCAGVGSRHTRSATLHSGHCTPVTGIPPQLDDAIATHQRGLCIRSNKEDWPANLQSNQAVDVQAQLAGCALLGGTWQRRTPQLTRRQTSDANAVLAGSVSASNGAAAPLAGEPSQATGLASVDEDIPAASSSARSISGRGRADRNATTSSQPPSSALDPLLSATLWAVIQPREGLSCDCSFVCNSLQEASAQGNIMADSTSSGVSASAICGQGVASINAEAYHTFEGKLAGAVAHIEQYCHWLTIPSSCLQVCCTALSR